METSAINQMAVAYVHVRGGRYPAYADEHGTVRVYDPVAGHYTTCVTLTPSQIRHVRAASKRSA